MDTVASNLHEETGHLQPAIAAGGHADQRHAGGKPEFVPPVPTSLDEARISSNQVESLALKSLLHGGTATGRQLAGQLALPFGIVETILHRLKSELKVVFRSTAPASDYVYELTDSGTERARRDSRDCTYCGAAPVALEQYIASVAVQSVRRQQPKLHDLREAFADLVLGEDILGRIGEAVNAGLGFFLSGAPGNGKTSIAERVTRAYGETIWIPRAISACGEIVRLYDPSVHEAVPPSEADGLPPANEIDQRWIRIRRPTVVVGGELTMEQLEVTKNPITGVIEAPLQLKSNCGTLVIDDFGRQRIRPDELLNRWIVPLEKRCDYLNLPSGRTFQVPFDQLIIFSTNLEPRDLVDEAFLRRIPYKIEVNDPSPGQFKEVFQRRAEEVGIDTDQSVVDYLLDRHFAAAGRPLRFCHAHDLLHQIRNACDFREQPLAVSCEALDAAVCNYFGGLTESGQ